MKWIYPVLVALTCNAYAQQPLVAYTLAEKDLIPEGITFSALTKSFYVGSIHKHKIIQVTSAGAVSDFITSGKYELMEVLGLITDENGLLWACNNSPGYDTTRSCSNVHVFDLNSSTLKMKYTVAHDGNKHRLNDLYQTKKGDVYITDTQAGMLWVIYKGATEIVPFSAPQSLPEANGITASADESKLVVSTAKGVIFLDLNTKDQTPFHSRFQLAGYDGLYRYNNSFIGIQNIYFPEAIHRITSIGEVSMACPTLKQFNIPTTGVIVEDHFYFIANSQLLQLIGNHGKIRNASALTPTYIVKIKLK